ncbi:MAG: hypothetical protein A2Z16_00080 [Chloroflexi bacterium RBG_16_54_18]|nr:MAG: hypothetical protein A2Z16_00080 [Chloroflexi bacterium RBG_16_54_18]
MEPSQHASAVLEGSRLALARLMTQVENGEEQGLQVLDILFAYTGRAHLVGVTGSPGTGKSSLVNQLALSYRKPMVGEPRRVGVVAVDPSSPFTGGAILGDRVRMRDLAGDLGVFIRSMATRGSLGGLAASTSRLVQALDAAGYEVILIETVGAGQAEVDVARLAHTTLVVEAPGLGDDIQAIKAGILEIADILVVNKADRPGVESTERALRSMLQLAHPTRHIFVDSGGHHAMQTEFSSAETAHSAGPGDGIPASESDEWMWTPPILRTVAIEGQGVQELAAEIVKHRQYLVDSGGLEQRERQRVKTEVDNLLHDRLLRQWRSSIPSELYNEVIRRVMDRETSPWQAARELAA